MADAYIAGVGESALGRVPDRGAFALCADAAVAAVADAGLAREDIDGLIMLESRTVRHARQAISMAQYLGLSSERMRWAQLSGNGALSSSGMALREATMAIAAGVCEHVLIVGGDDQLSVGRDWAVTRMAENRDSEFESPYGSLVGATLAIVATRYANDFGLTEDDLALAPVASREWAARNPNAHMHDRPLTVDEVIESPMITTPLRRYHCAIVSDGASALVVTSRPLDSRSIELIGSSVSLGRGDGHVVDDLGQMPDLYGIRSVTREATRRLLGPVGVTAASVDLLYTYDPFSFVPFLQFEALGLCVDGEGAAFAREAGLGPDGSLNWNTHGGLLAHCHTGNSAGQFAFVEAVRQLRHEAGDRQRPTASTALVVGYGANMSAIPCTMLAAS